MKEVYAIIITPPENGEKYYTVTVPDLELYTQGKDIVECIAMAKDVIGLYGITLEDKKQQIPHANNLKPEAESNEIVTLVDVDFNEYRKKNENKTIRKNCTIPLWLNNAAEERNINFSAVLTKALREIID